ncbi:MAG: amidohydrolase family protein [Acidimicrobiales bacterium]
MNGTKDRVEALVLRGATLPDGSRGVVRIVGDRVAEAGPAIRAKPTDMAVDLVGYVLLPALVEPHAHLDKAFTAEQAPNPDGDLPGAIAAWVDARPGFTTDDIIGRARQAALAYLVHGCTLIRTHVDVSAEIGLRGLHALMAVRDELAGAVDIELIAMCNNPVSGRAGKGNLAILRDALAAGADGVGGAPWLDADPPGATEILADVAGEYDRVLDLHVDETTDASVSSLALLGELAGRGFPKSITASHIVSLAGQPVGRQRRLAATLAAARIGVVTLPQTNLWLQGRGGGPVPSRGLTAVRVLLDAGVLVAAGGDNLRDPFNPFGRADPFATASLLAVAAHLSPAEALAAVTVDAWHVLGRRAPQITSGQPAHFVAVAGTSAADAMAGAPETRIVFRGSRIVARSTTQRELSIPSKLSAADLQYHDRRVSRAVGATTGVQW